LTFVFVVIYTYVSYDKTKTEKLNTLSYITTLPNLSLSYSQWESRFYDDYKTEIFPELQKINYMDFTYAK